MRMSTGPPSEALCRALTSDFGFVLSFNHPSTSAEVTFWDEALAQDLLKFLSGRVKCQETAADLTHETYLQLHTFAAKTPPDNARALAFHIAVNLAIDYQRKRLVRERYHSEVPLDELHDLLPTPTASPERAIIAKQRLQHLQHALNELPSDCRTAFLLHGLEGLSYSEIAARLRISESMVGKHLRRAMTHCASKLENS